MVAETLREGFARAHRRPGVILLDVIWKLIWFALTVVAVVIVALVVGAALIARVLGGQVGVRE